MRFFVIIRRFSISKNKSKILKSAVLGSHLYGDVNGLGLGRVHDGSGPRHMPNKLYMPRPGPDSFSQLNWIRFQAHLKIGTCCNIIRVCTLNNLQLITCNLQA